MLGNVKLFVYGISHEYSSAELVGKCGIPKDECTNCEKKAIQSNIIEEITILSTCNRVEIYWTSSDKEASLKAIISSITTQERKYDEFQTQAYLKENVDAIAHLFEVASGLRSQMTGETEIFGQVKAAYARASQAGNCKAFLNQLFQKAAQCGKWIRTNTEIGHGKISIGSVASELASRIFEDITKANILMLGSGEVGKNVAEALFVRGAQNITVASRTRKNADTLAESIGVKSTDMSEALDCIDKFDICICASFAKVWLITEQSANEAILARNGKPIFLIDLSVPANIDPSCANIDDIYLYNLTDLSKIAEENMHTRKAQIVEAKNIISEKALSLYKKMF